MLTRQKGESAFGTVVWAQHPLWTPKSAILDLWPSWPGGYCLSGFGSIAFGHFSDHFRDHFVTHLCHPLCHFRRSLWTVLVSGLANPETPTSDTFCVTFLTSLAPEKCQKVGTTFGSHFWAPFLASSPAQPVSVVVLESENQRFWGLWSRSRIGTSRLWIWRLASLAKAEC